jgi:hypothetical protein
MGLIVSKDHIFKEKNEEYFEKVNILIKKVASLEKKDILSNEKIIELEKKLELKSDKRKK